MGRLVMDIEPSLKEWNLTGVKKSLVEKYSIFNSD